MDDDRPPCLVCRKPCHSATYHWMGPAFPDVFLCGPCACHMVQFIKFQMSRKVGRMSRFYDEALTSIRPKWPGQPGAVWYIPITAPETLEDWNP